MNSRRLSFQALLIGLLLLCGVGGLVLWTVRSAAPPAGPLAGAKIGGAFELVDQDGRPVTDQSYPGKYKLVYFGYTYCPDVCPLDVQKIATAMRSFEKSDPRRASKVQPIFITVDPERDTQPVLKTFVAAFHPRLVGLGGTVAQVDAAKRAYKVYAAKAGPAGAADYLVDHSAMVYLIGPDGAPISFADHSATAAQIARDLDTYVR
ncbi:MAG: SCO family protein [Polymorphobacter sp.]